MLRLTDLREILRYVPRFRDKLFVIALDGSVVAHENFGNLLLDIALLRSLRIHVVLVHGAGHQIRLLAEKNNIAVSSLDGTGVTDAATMELSLTAANQVSHNILAGLSATDLLGVVGNAVVAHPAGILHGVPHQFTGRVERIEVDMLQALLDRNIIPVIPPLGWDGEGTTYRINSDAVAYEVARAMTAVKLIFLTDYDGIRLFDRSDNEDEASGSLIRQLSVDEAEKIAKTRRDLPGTVASKLDYAVRAARQGIPRVHIINGTVEEGLLAEVFSNEGIGTLIYANEYQAIRKAMKKDVGPILSLLRAAMDSEELLRRTRSDIEEQINDFFVFEVDRTLVACAAVHFYEEGKEAELACVCVDPAYENQGIGSRLVQFAENHARNRKASKFFCLSTQAYNYFVHKAGFKQGSVDDLPPARRERYERSGRKSQILVKTL
ncbi:MAG: amino-acid acetyltransferase [Gemmatales bacterium]|nr:MAG: amino-acid acetyltransferase [Gemmatales bacterium]